MSEYRKYTKDAFKATDHCQYRTFITNKYSGARIAVDCGQCDYCIWKRAQKNSMRVKTAGSKFKYCYFVTLTYNQSNIPLFKCEILHSEYDSVLNDSNDKIYSDEKHTYFPVSSYTGDSDSNKLHHVFFTQVQGTVPFDREVKEYIPVKDSWFCTLNGIRSFIRKAECPDSPFPLQSEYGHNLIPFLNYTDVQNYIKRLRKHISTYTDEKIHFYAVGEYGPFHFRPHFHVLLFTNSEKVSEVLRQCHDKSWKLGGSDFQRAAKGAASYVSSYINSLSSAPQLYRSCHSFKPKYRASKGFFEKGDSEFPDLDDDETVRKKIYSVLNGIEYNFNGICVRSTPPLSYVRSLLPRFESVGNDDCSAIVRVLCAVSTTPQRLARLGMIDYDQDSTLSLVRKYCEYLCNQPYLYDADRLILHQCRCTTRNCNFSNTDYDSALMKLYRLFLYCRSFFRNWHLPDFGEDIVTWRSKIIRIVKIGIEEEKDLDYTRLIDSLTLQSEYPDLSHEMFALPQSCEIDFQPNDADMDLLSQLKFRAATYCRDMVKHKKLNDANNLLNKTI